MASISQLGARPESRPADSDADRSGRTPPANWSWDGGTAVTVAPGDTVDSIARRYGVPASAIMQANNIAAPATLHPGQRLVIPRYSCDAGRNRGQRRSRGSRAGAGRAP